MFDVLLAVGLIISGGFALASVVFMGFAMWTFHKARETMKP